MGGIDRDVERIFLRLEPHLLEVVFQRYGSAHGDGALKYARRTYLSWRDGHVGMSGTVAERLLNLVPLVLDQGTRFDLVRKLRTAHLPRKELSIACELTRWRETVVPAVDELISASASFELPRNAIERVTWLASGDARAAQALLAAAEQEEAAVRVAYLESEFSRLDRMIQDLEGRAEARHSIELPQGTIHITVAARRRGAWELIRALFA